MYERFTDRARKTMALGNVYACRLNHEQIDTEHVLLGLIEQESNLALQLLKEQGVDPNRIRDRILQAATLGPTSTPTVKLPVTAQAKTAVSAAITEARELGHNHIGTEHLLLALATVPDSQAARIFADVGLRYESLRKAIQAHYENNPPPPPTSSDHTLIEILNRLTLAREQAAGEGNRARAKQILELIRRTRAILDLHTDSGVSAGRNRRWWAETATIIAVILPLAAFLLWLYLARR